MQKLFHEFAAYLTVVYASGHGFKGIALFLNPIYCWAFLLAMSSNSDCRF